MSEGDTSSRSGASFRSATDLPSGHPERELQKQYLYNLEISDFGVTGNGLVLSSGMMSRLGMTPAKAKKLAELRGDEDFWMFFWHLIIQDILDQIDQRLAYHRAEMERLLTEIATNEAELSDLRKDHAVLNRVIDHYREEGALDIDYSAQKAIDAYEKRRNLKVNEPTYSDILEIRADIESEETRLESIIHEQLQKYEFHQEREAELTRLREEIENGGTQQRITAIQRFAGYEANQSFVRVSSPGTSTDRNTLLHLKESKITGSSSGSDHEAGFSFDFPPLAEEFDQAMMKEPPEERTDINVHQEPSKPIIRKP